MKIFHFVFFILFFSITNIPFLRSQQFTQDEFEEHLTEAYRLSNNQLVKSLIGDHRLMVKPFVNRIIRESISLELNGNIIEAQQKQSLAEKTASTFKNIHSEKSLVIAVNYLSYWSKEQKEKKVLADSLFALGTSIRGNRQQHEKAIEYYQQALDIYTEIGDERGEAGILGGLGFIYWSIDSDTCLVYYQKALVARKSVDDRFLVGATLNSLGVVYLQHYSDLDSAIYYLEKATRVRHEIGDLTGLGKSLVYLALTYEYNGQYVKAEDAYHEAYQVNKQVGNKIKMAEAMQNSAYLLSGTGHYLEALQNLDAALKLREELNDPVKIGNVLNDQGNVYANIRDFDRAIELYAKSAEIMNNEGNLDGQANAFNNIGTILDEVGRFQKAIEYYTRSIEICRQTEDRKGIGTALGNLGNTYYGLGDYEESERYQYQALQISRELNLHDNEIHNLINLSNAQNALGKLDSARFNSNLALGKSTELDNPQLIWISTLNLGDNYEKRGEYQQAIDHYERALGIVEEIRLSLTGEEYRSEYMAAERFAFEGLIQLLGRLHLNEPDEGFDRKAFLYAERSKSRAFLDMLSDSVQPATLQDVQESVPDEESVILEYFLGDSSSFLWVISEEEHELFILPGRNELKNNIETIRFSLTKPDASNLPFFTRSAQMLYKQLLEQAVPYIEKGKKLVIIPDGELYYLPFEVLLTKAPKRGKSSDPTTLPYLVKKHPLSYGHSATILMNMSTGIQAEGGMQPRLLAFGDPEFSSQYKRLEYSAGEVESISSFFEPSGADVFVQNEASEKRIKNTPMDQYSHIHFATHGTVDEVIPDFSSLVLAMDPDRNEDGLLQAWEIMDLELNADLVVLSACQSGLGKMVRGEGMVGLTRAFMYAGTPTVLVSLWNVADISTAGLMEKFYENLIKKELTKTDALRRAQLSMIKDEQFAHPFYWAPFVLIGDWQ